MNHNAAHPVHHGPGPRQTSDHAVHHSSHNHRTKGRAGDLQRVEGSLYTAVGRCMNDPGLDNNRRGRRIYHQILAL